MKTKNTNKTTTEATTYNHHMKTLFPHFSWENVQNRARLSRISLIAGKNTVKGKLFTLLNNLHTTKKAISIASIEKKVYGLKRYATSIDNSSTYVKKVVRSLILRHPECFQVVSTASKGGTNKIVIVKALPVSVTEAKKK